MPVERTQIRRGMEVYSLHGEKIGEVLRAPAGGQAEQVAPSTPPAASQELSDGGGLVGNVGGPMGTPGMTGVPLGTNTDKGRGRPTIMGQAAERGDIPTTPGERGITPGQDGLNALPQGADRSPTEVPMPGMGGAEPDGAMTAATPSSSRIPACSASARGHCACR